MPSEIAANLALALVAGRERRGTRCRRWLTFYALPYRAAAGQGIGELVLSLGCGLVLVACGLLARWAVLRRL